ncbi:PP2C family protein-serine/threonine phosphatase [Mycoplasmopsis felifaucium]|uniref:PP2C family protein-serine/threonine phosphatase n=1 Tax=Mycoplasmopsis felifaucium TaxID=35768 RepID=UPI000481F259|nr:protein phosphatase 2C domain-containing protein [Mycoplasmopsis felifaucium]
MDYGKTSDVGKVRLENQDALATFVNDDFSLLILCDGMGGHYGGGLASSIAINVFDKEFRKSLPKLDENYKVQTYIDWFKKTVSQAKKEMIKISDKDEAKLDMGTTVTGALICEKAKFIVIFNIGDSRTYILTTYGEIKQITIDHNYLNQLISQGVPEIEAKKFRNQASLTSALGPDKKTKIEIFTIDSKDFDSIYAIVSTSDGTHDFINKPILEAMLRKNESAQKLSSEIVNYALDNHSTDNASCGIVILDNKPVWRKKW